MRIGTRVTNVAVIHGAEPGTLKGEVVSIGRALCCAPGRGDYEVNSYDIKWDNGIVDWHIKRNLLSIKKHLLAG